MRRLMVVVGVLGLVLAGCGDDDSPAVSGSGTETTVASASSAKDVVGITMAEYSYAVDGTLKAGGTVKLTNAGKEFHMLGVGKLKEGKTIADVKAALSQPEGGDGATTETTAAERDGAADQGGEDGDQGDDPTKDVLDEVSQPAGIFGPGQTAEVTAPDFGEGEYALICFIPVEGDAEGTPHFQKGMIGSLKVAAAKATEPTADASYSIEAGKAITGPATLSAGRHVLKLSASGEGAGDLEPVLGKPDPGKTLADMDAVFDSFESDNGFSLPVGAADKVPGDVIAGLFDFGSSTTVYLTVDLTPGTYALGAQDTDVDNAPNDPVEKILIKVT